MKHRIILLGNVEQGEIETIEIEDIESEHIEIEHIQTVSLIQHGTHENEADANHSALISAVKTCHT